MKLNTRTHERWFHPPHFTVHFRICRTLPKWPKTIRVCLTCSTVRLIQRMSIDCECMLWRNKSHITILPSAIIDDFFFSGQFSFRMRSECLNGISTISYFILDNFFFYYESNSWFHCCFHNNGVNIFIFVRVLKGLMYRCLSWIVHES